MVKTCKTERKIKQLEAENERLREVTEAVAKKPEHVQGWMRANDIVVDNLDDRWQKAFFSVYTDLVEVAEKCRALLEGKE